MGLFSVGWRGPASLSEICGVRYRRRIRGGDTAVMSRDVVGRLTLRAVVTLGRRLALVCARGKLTDREWIYCWAITEAGWPSPVDQWP